MKDLVGSLSTHGSQDIDMYDERLFLCHIYLVKKGVFVNVHYL